MLKTAIGGPPVRGRHCHITKTLFVTKLTFLLTIAAVLQVAANGFAQTISLQAKDTPLKTIFTAIKQQTGYSVIYSEDLLDKANKVTLHVTNVPLSTFLQEVFKDQPLTYSVKNTTIFILRKSAADKTDKATGPDMPVPPVPVRGRVTGGDGQALPAATIVVKGTRHGVSAGADGSFTIDAAVGDVLMITAVGYEPVEIRLTSATAAVVVSAGRQPADSEPDNIPTRPLLANDATLGLLIALRPAVAKLDNVEVVVSTGYQRLPKERSTGSFSQIDRKLFNQQVGTTILERLETIGNGLVVDKTYGANPVYMVRGLSTIEGPRDVLIIVDNFPYEGEIRNINPNDVESITILKDAAAASIWGARAGNGVIVITTKSGKYNKPTSISVNSNLTVAEKPDLYKVPQISSAGYVELEKFLFDKGYYNSRINRKPSYEILSPVVEWLIKRKQATNDADRQAIDAQIDAYKDRDIRRDMTDYLYHHAINQQYAVSFNGGTNSYAWAGSFNYDQNRSELGAVYSRFNAGFRQQLKPLKNLEISTGLYYTQSVSNSGAKGYGAVTQTGNGFFPYTRIADDNGHPIGIDRTYRSAWTDTVLAGKLLDWKYYPLTDWKSDNKKTTLQDILLTAGIRYQVWPMLGIDLKYQYEKQLQELITLNGVDSWLMRSTINLYTQRGANGTTTYGYPYGGKYQFSHPNMSSHQVRGQLNLNKQWQRHEVVAMAGGEVRIINKKSNGGGMYGYDEELLTYTPLVNNGTRIPSLIGGSTTLSDLSGLVLDNTTNFISFFGNAAYTYVSKYSLSVSTRSDASNLFGLRTNDQWNQFFSTGLSWFISKEKFYQAPWLPFLKLRATYGLSGNISPDKVAVATVAYSNTKNPYTATPMARFQNFQNKDLRWETARQLNFGIDFETRNRLFYGSIEYFRKNGIDLFGNDLLDYTGGVGKSITQNAAKIKGQGMDLDLSMQLVSHAFKWVTHLNFSIYKDKIVDYYLNSAYGSSYLTQLRPGFASTPGRPVNSVYSYKWGGLDPQTGDPIGYLKGDPSKNYNSIYLNTLQDELVFHGSSIPTHYGNWNNSFSYKNIELNVGLNFKLHYYVRRESVQYDQLVSQAIGHSDYDRRWQQPGDEQFTQVPSFKYPIDSYRENFYLFSETLVEKGDHIRLRYIQLNYQFAQKLLRTSPFRDARLYVNANNLGILWKASDRVVDPDNTYRYSSFFVQVPRSYTIGLNLNF